MTLKVQRNQGCGVLEADHIRVQRLAWKTGGCRISPAPAAPAAIGLVADEGVSALAQVNADLVGSSGGEAAFDERRRRGESAQ